MSAKPREAAWLDPRRPLEPGRFKLFCLPHAGGGSVLFQSWQAHFGSRLDVAPVLLPGRDRRMRESAIDSVRTLARAMARGLERELLSPYAIFGHSMGALIAYEFCHALRELDLPEPGHLFAAGFRAPHLPDRNPQLHELSDEELVSALELLGGTPPEILEFEGLMALMLPTVRADLRMVETYRWTEREPLSVPITSICSSADPLVSREETEQWGQLTSGSFDSVEVAGGHFFLDAQREPLLSAIEARLAKRESC